MFTLQEREHPISQLLSGVGNIAGQGIQGYFEGQKKQKEQRSITDLLSNMDSEASPIEFAKKLGEARDISDEKKSSLWKMYNEAQGIEQKGKSRTQNYTPENLATVEKYLGKEVAELLPLLPVGAQTETVKRALEKASRDKRPGEIFGQEGFEYPETSATKSVSEPSESLIKPPKKYGPPKGLTDKEKVKWQESRRKENLPHYEESSTKHKIFKNEKVDMGILKDINDRGNLPEDFSKILVDPETGDIRDWAKILPGIQNPDVERFVKTLANFSRNAKESYGSRVTNFDLQQFLKRYPGLLNTPEGRRQIIEQMMLVSELSDLYNEALVDVYRTSGVGNITFEEADEEAQRRIADRETDIIQKISQIGIDVPMPFSLKELPNPAEAKGKRAEGENGKIYRSDGTQWIEEK